jgi:arabinan endo-1,5-alpha-L-arabinosidase
VLQVRYEEFTTSGKRVSLVSVELANALPDIGDRYSIRVGRSKSPRGPFVDKQGRDLANGGGEIVYASNRDVYAPGGQGVLTEKSGDTLYYHYCRFPVVQRST